MELAKERRRDAGPGRIQRIERPGSKRGRMRGLTIIEVPIALTMLGFGLLAMAPLFTGAVRTNASSNQLTNANTLAREKMEELIGFPSTDPRLSVSYTNNAAGPDTTSTGTGSIVDTNDYCKNDLPLWYKPSSGETSKAPT